MREKDVAGLTFEEMQERLAIETTPTSVARVKLPKGTSLYEGIVGPNFEKNGGAWQIYINASEINENWFKSLSWPLK